MVVEMSYRKALLPAWESYLDTDTICDVFTSVHVDCNAVWIIDNHQGASDEFQF